MRRTMSKAAVVTAVAAFCLALSGAAMADNSGYDSRASSSGGVGVPGVFSQGSRGETRATEEGTTASSSGWSFAVAGMELSPASSCDASSQAGQGAVVKERDGSVQTIGGGEGDPATVVVLASSCKARAQSNNNAHTEAGGALLTAVVPGAGSATVLAGHSETHTTSGSSSATTSSTVASASAGGTGVVVLECGSYASSDGTASDSATFVRAGDTSLDGPEEADCPSGQSQASRTDED